MTNWLLSKPGIGWTVSLNDIADSGLELIEVKRSCARSRVFWRWLGTGFRLDRRLKSGYYFGGKRGSRCKGKISAQIHPWRSLRTQTYFRLSLVSAENNVSEPEPGNDFCDVMTFVSLWPIRFYDRMKLECSSQRIPRAVVLGLLELNCDWLKIPTSQKSFPGSGLQTLFSAETSDSRKYVCIRRLPLARCWLFFRHIPCRIVSWKVIDILRT